MLYCAAEDYMARGKSIEDISTLQMALVGYQIEKQRIEARIEELRAKVRGKRAAAPTAMGETKAPVKRDLSEAARKRIAAAQKRRWAEYRKRKAAAPKAQAAKAASAQA